MMRQIPFIDIHTHLFNGRYLPLHGILRSWDIPPITAWALATLLVPLVGKSRFEKGPEDDSDQSDILDALADGSVNRVHRTILKRLEKALVSSAKSSMDEQLDRQTLDEMTQALSELHSRFNGEKNSFALSSDRMEQIASDIEVDSEEPSELLLELNNIMMPAFQDAALHAEGNGYFEGHDHSGGHADHAHEGDLSTIDNKSFPAQQAGSLLQMLIFFLSMFLSERNRYRALQSDYAKGKPDDGHDPLHMVTLLPDMRRAFERTVGGRLKRPYFSARDQVKRGAALARESDGVLIPFGTIDPFRGDSWIDNVERAQRIGITGFKIYPPMGFRPISPIQISDDPMFAPIELSKEEKYKLYIRNISVKNDPQTERVMGEIVSYCAENNLQLFAHCTPLGFEATEGFGTNCHPVFWASAMEAYGAQNLRLCLGHGGGATKVDFGGWLAEDEDWEKTMAYRGTLMCQRYPNVYMGLGYLIPLLHSEQRDQVLDRLERILTSPIVGSYAMADKFIFGTDWSMPQIIGKTRSFLNIFYEFFERPAFIGTDTPERVMRKNAQSYLNIPVS